MWRAFSTIDQNNKYNPVYKDYLKDKPYPFSITPSNKVSPFDLITLHRDY